MHFQKNVSLRSHSTMRLGGTAAYLAEIHDKNELQEAVAWAAARSLPVMMIGTGSNIVWRDEGFAGLVLVDKILGFDMQPDETESDAETDGGITAKTETNVKADAEGPDDTCLVMIGGGEPWDEVVARTTNAGLTGIEALSLIPGTAGATPVQNVGAYGQEIKNVLMSVAAYDCQTHQFVDVPAAECGFGYRTSRFKTVDHGRFFIVSITFRLRRGNPKPPFYGALQSYFDAHDIGAFTPQIVRDAVIAIRRSKLPDPKHVANNGSFFANPILSAAVFEPLRAAYPAIPNWSTTDGQFKIPAAWLLEQAGFKNARDASTGMATWPAQPLVLVNEHARATADLLAFKQKITDAVLQKFDIALEQEPELLP
jgi:UDP-N-acetylmuramate dehydrogenase